MEFNIRKEGDGLYEQIIAMLREQNKTMKEIKQQLNNIEKILNDIPNLNSPV